MTLPSGSNLPPISLGDIHTEFGLGTNLNAYRNGIWGKDDNTCGLFASGSINISDFYSKKKVTAGSSTDSTPGNKSVTIPPYRTVTFTLIGAGGGGGGGGGSTNNTGSCDTPPAPGGNSASGTSSFASGTTWALSAGGGGGGGGGGGASNPYTGSAGANASTYNSTYVSRASGGGGNSSGGAGGGGGYATSITYTNPVLGGSGPTSGSSLAYLLASGGAGGEGGEGRDLQGNQFIGYKCVAYSPRYGSAGGNGANAQFTITWTGQ